MLNDRKERIRYALLKIIEENTDRSFDDKSEISVEAMGVSEDKGKAAIAFLLRNKYIVGGSTGSNKLYTTKFIIITEKGEQYLKDNSPIAKGYRVLKEIKDFIPFISG